MPMSHKPVIILLGLIFGLVLVPATLAPVADARPVAPEVTVIHSSLINTSPSDPEVGETVTFEVADPTVSGQFIADLEWRFPDGSSVSGADRTRARYRFGEAGVYTVSLRIEALSPYQIIRASTSVDVRPSENTGGGEVSVRAMLRSYDDNGDNRLDNAEFTGVINAWVASRISNAAFIEALELWVHQETIVRVDGAASSTSVRLIHHGNRQVTVRATQQDAASVRFSLYDQVGTKLLTRESRGNSLTVNLGLVEGHALPNGVYFAEVRVQGMDGDVERTMQPMSLMR